MSRRRKCHSKVRITRDLVSTVVRWDMCSCSGIQPYLEEDFVLRIKRKGQDEYCVEYDPWETTNVGIMFLWDDAVYDLPYGRYDADLYYLGDLCGTFELEIKKPNFVTGLFDHKKEKC